MNTVRFPRNSKVCIRKVEIIETPNRQVQRRTQICTLRYSNAPNLLKSSTNALKRMKLNNASSAARRPAQSVVLNSIINLNSGTTNRDANAHHAMATEDFFLNNENNCFYKCVFCSETIKSKPSYRTHIQTSHGTTVNKYHIQKEFIDATKEFCTEFVQTDFSIIHSLTSIFDHIDNIDRIIRDHKKRFRCDNLYAYAEDPIADTYLKDEAVVLKLYGEMIQRAFDILSEKNELIVGLQDDVTELLEQDDSLNHQKQSDKDELNEEPIKEEEGEPAYELYYIEDDPNQQKCDIGATGTSTAKKIDSTKVKAFAHKSTTSKRGRPKGDSARSLDECLAELPAANAEYIRSMNANSEAKYQCDTCDVSAKTKMLLCVHHLRVHLKRKDKICPHCDRAFASQGDLTRHIRIHSGECPFKCEFEDCTSEFKTSGDLKKHSIVHEPLHRAFECSECESKFARQTDLTRQKKIHLIGKEGVGFTCELCNRVFYRKDLFRAHENHHLKIRPFGCSHCLKRFAKKYDLLKYIDRQHKAVDCDKCGDSFETRSKLIEHFRSGTCKDADS